MSPQETEDIHVHALGPCTVCGQEQLLRTRGFVDASNGIRIEVRQYTDCACGLKRIDPPHTELS